MNHKLPNHFSNTNLQEIQGTEKHIKLFHKGIISNIQTGETPWQESCLSVGQWDVTGKSMSSFLKESLKEGDFPTRWMECKCDSLSLSSHLEP